MRDLCAMTETQVASTSHASPHPEDLRVRVARIALLHRQGALASVTDELHALERAARDGHFDALEDLAHVLEAEITATGSAALVRAYMDCMDEAISGGASGPSASETMFAAIRARMLS